MPEGTITPPNYPDPIKNNVNMLPSQMVGTLKANNEGALQPAPYATENSPVEPDPTASVEATADPEPEKEPEVSEKTKEPEETQEEEQAPEDLQEEESSEEPEEESKEEEKSEEKDPTPTDQWTQVDDSLTVVELKSIAKDEGIKGYSNMRQDELIETINEKRAEDKS